MKNSNVIQLDANSTAQRRLILKSILATAMLNSLWPEIVYAAALTKEERDRMSADLIIDELKKGNERFRTGKPLRHDYLAQKRSSIDGQFPAAVILSCIDSRAPGEILFDTGIGDTYNSRVAGNICNVDILGGLEYACAVTGAKVIVVMGHTSCGAVKGAIDDVKLGNLTELLQKIKPAIDQTAYLGERVGKNAAFVDAVARTNVSMTVQQIRQQSQILRALETDGKLKIIGSMYSLKGGEVTFFG